MKTTTTFLKHGFLILVTALSLAACKKDKKNDPAPPPPEVKTIKLTDLKGLTGNGASAKVPDNTKISGIVISDVISKNIDSKTVILQDATTQSGIIITFDAAQTFALGDQLDVTISNQTIAQVNGEVVLQNIPAANAKKTGTGTIAAKTTTIAEIGTNKTTWDGTLVNIAATELTGGNGKYTGALTIKDASGTTTSNVLAGASFENTAYPVSVSGITGIVRTNGTDVRIDIRKTSDVVTGAITRLLTEDFTNMTSLDPSSSSTYFYSGGFTTAVGEWSQNQFAPSNPPQAWGGADIKGEGNFLAPGKTYLYLRATNDVVTSNNGLPCAFTNLEGLKNITITWAQSEATSIDYNFYDNPSTFEMDPFNPSNDYTQVAVKLPITNSSGVNLDITIDKSTKYMAAGKFNTYTFTLPTKDQLVTAGGNVTAVDNWLKNPVFAIYNISKTTKGTSAIVIDKVVFGFGN